MEQSLRIGIQHSVLRADGLNEKLLRRYGLGQTVTRLYQTGMNDIYHVRHAAGTCYLRVSPHGFRTYQEIEAEIMLLLQLDEQDIPVALPLARDDGSYITTLSSPEGERYAVLFEDAGGEIRGVKTRQELSSLGAVLARIHLFRPDTNAYRKVLDEIYFLDAPLDAMLHYYDGTAQGQELARLAGILRLEFARHREDSFGLLHADPHNYNIRFTGGRPVLFDFDSFGYGPQMYDLGEQYWNMTMFQLPPAEEAQQLAFLLEGYESVRPLSSAQRESIGYFALVRDFRLMGAQLLSTFRNRGTSFIDKEYAQGHIDYLRRGFASLGLGLLP